jgi:CheY-like chemotaxis protein
MAALFLTTDLLYSSKITTAARQMGRELAMVGSADEAVRRASLEPAPLVLVDLGTRGLDVADLVNRLRALPEPPKAIVGFGAHVNASQLEGAASGGCDLVLTRGQLHANTAAVLAKYLA